MTAASGAVATPAAPTPPETWHVLDAAAVARGLGTSLDAGLDDEEAARRLAAHGANELAADRAPTRWHVLAEQLRNVLVLILLVAVALSAGLGHVTEAVVITVIVLFAVVLGFVQEYRAERALEALRGMSAPTAAVVRGGEERDLPAREIVPGDVVLLRVGDKVPADARLAEAVALQVDEAALTGESVPAGKAVGALDDPAAPVGDRANMVFGGTSVTHGRGRAVVVATGPGTEFGGIARMLAGIERARTPLQVNLDRVAVLLARFSLALVVLVVALGLLRDEPFLDMLLFGAAVAVAVVPEALPAVVTISLTLAAQRMARRHALIRRLSATETLGSVSVICSDKTGTLTKDEMTARKVFVAGRMLSVSGTGYEPEGAYSCDGVEEEPTAELVEILRGAALASDAQLVRDEADGRWHIRGDPTEGALVVAAAKAGLHRARLDAERPRTGELPFTAERMRMTTLHDSPEGPVAYSKGAPEVVIPSCTRWLRADGERPMDVGARGELLAAAAAMAGEGLRVLAVARRAAATPDRVEERMTFLGLVGMIDPPRPEARAAVATCETAGITPVMITGDHPLTARAVAREVGVLTEGRVVTGAELEAMDDAALERDVDRIQVYARVSPADKLRVVGAWQRRGHSVAVTGDGVNDAPALKKANIGVAMGVTGTDIAKEAAEMTLTDDNFASIVAAVEEGRKVFGNIKKYLMYLLSANLGEIGLLVGASLAGLPIPLTAVLILYVNLATDGLPALALSVDPPAPDLMRRRPRKHDEGIFSRRVVGLILLGGSWSTLVTLSLFAWAQSSARTDAEASTLTFTTLVLIEFFKAYCYRSDRRSAFDRVFANRWLNLAVLWELVALALVLNLGFLQDAFGTTGLSAGEWLLAVGCAATIVPVLEAAKLIIRRSSGAGRRRRGGARTPPR